MSSTARTDTKLKKGVQRKKTDEIGKLSPTHSEIEEKVTFKVIDGEDIQSLAIKEDDLKKLGKPKVVKEEKNESLLVKKVNKNAYPTIEVKVAKLAPNKPIKPIDTSDALGLRYDKYGNCIPHSILGNVEDYLQECVAHGKSIDLPYDTVDSDRPEANLYIKPAKTMQEKKKNKLNKSLTGDFGQNALQNWYDNMNVRKNIQKHIANKTDRPVNNLVSNQADNVLHYNETKTLIDRTLPLIEHGKGYRTGSEFWNQPYLIGDAETGIHVSLTKSQRGLASPLELVSRPDIILEETTFRDNQPPMTNYPWNKSKYLEKRLETLKPLIKEQISHMPKFDQLQVVGQNPLLSNNRSKKLSAKSDSIQTDQNEYMINDTWINQNIIDSDKYQTDIININNPYYVNIDNNSYGDVLSSHPDVIQPPIFGPCIIFGGQTARWNGSSNENLGVIALESRLNFETKAGKRVLATFEIINIGTSTIYYDWKKIADINPFQVANSKVQRFYFDTRSNVILPGDLLKLHIVFKSLKGGIFTEKWEFITHPPMLSGASLVLTLRGVAIQEDKFKKRRISIERSLFVKEAELIAKNMVELILDGVRTPERPSSPENAFMTEEDEFAMKNPHFHYDHDSVQEIKKLYLELFEAYEEKQDFYEWDLSIDDFKQILMDLDEQDPKKQSLLARLNALLANMSFTYDKPNESKLYTICYNLLCLTIDEISTDLFNLKSNLSLPINDEYYPSPDEFNKNYEDWKKEFEIFKQIEVEKKNRLEKEKGKDGKGGGGGKGGKGGDAKKDDKKKDDKNNNKKTPVLSANANRSRIGREQNASRSASRNQDKIEERVKTPVQLTEQQLAIKSLFMEKAYLNVYQALSRTIDDMETVIDQNLKNVNLNDILSTYIKQNSESKQLNVQYMDYID